MLAYIFTKAKLCEMLTYGFFQSCQPTWQRTSWYHCTTRCCNFLGIGLWLSIMICLSSKELHGTIVPLLRNYFYIYFIFYMPMWQRDAWCRCTLTAATSLVPDYDMPLWQCDAWSHYTLTAATSLVLVYYMPLWQWDAWHHYTLTAAIRLLFELLQTISLLPQKDLDV